MGRGGRVEVVVSFILWAARDRMCRGFEMEVFLNHQEKLKTEYDILKE